MEDTPYRCPKCGDEVFTTLRHLRDHLDSKHSYQSPWKTKSYVISGRSSPLSERFKQETEELEKQLKMAEETEQFHKMQHGRKSLFNSTNQTLKNEQEYTPALLSSISDIAPLPTPVNLNTGPAPSNHKTPYEEYQSRLVRKPDPHTSNMLTKAAEQMQSLRKSTNELITQQRAEMERLKEESKDKDRQIAQANQELNKLTEESTTLQKELLELERKQSVEKGEIDGLREQLERKDAMIELKQQ